MSQPFDLNRTVEVIRMGRTDWRLHALRRMVERRISRDEVIDALGRGEVIEDYPDDQPYPSALVLGFMGNRPLHVVVAFDAGGPYAYIITVYEPSPDKFESDWRTRRKP